MEKTVEAQGIYPNIEQTLAEEKILSPQKSTKASRCLQKPSQRFKVQKVDNLGIK